MSLFTMWQSRVRTSTLSVLPAMLILAAACSPIVETRGHVSDEAALKTIRPGVTTREEVQALLGSPSSISNFGEETWYYITAKRERQAFLKPEITEQEVAQVSFDAAGTVKTMKGFTKDDAVAVTSVARTTPTEGHRLGFVEQVVGNLGRFNKALGDKRHTPAGVNPRGPI